MTITSGMKQNNNEKVIENNETCDDTREIPILRLSNSHDSSNGEPEKNNSSSIDDTDLSTLKQQDESTKESTNENQSIDENDVRNSIKVLIKLNYMLDIIYAKSKNIYNTSIIHFISLSFLFSESYSGKTTSQCKSPWYSRARADSKSGQHRHFTKETKGIGIYNEVYSKES